MVGKTKAVPIRNQARSGKEKRTCRLLIRIPTTTEEMVYQIEKTEITSNNIWEQALKTPDFEL